jgi:hypothetical protein
MSFTNLGCAGFGLKNPVTPTLDGNGVATAATFSVAQQHATGGTSTTGHRHWWGRRPLRHENPGQQDERPARRGY